MNVPAGGVGSDQRADDSAWPAIQAEINAAVAAIAALPHKTPPVIVLSDRGYLPILANWLAHARAAGVRNIVVVALDAATRQAMARRQVFTVSLPSIASHRQLWRRRAGLFAGLAAAGIDFIHSDADAVWLSSPVAEIFALDADLVFSSGTTWPRDVVAAWGFVLCCGLFGLRANPASAAFFDALLERMAHEHDDQLALNQLLFEMGATWRPAGDGEARQHKGHTFHIFAEPVMGQCRCQCRGEYAGNGAPLRLALLPHHRFPRLPEISPGAVVAHPLSHKNVDGTEETLRRLALWRKPSWPWSGLQRLWPFRRPSRLPGRG